MSHIARTVLAPYRYRCVGSQRRLEACKVTKKRSKIKKTQLITICSKENLFRPLNYRYWLQI
jgi:hypothetical protein